MRTRLFARFMLVVLLAGPGFATAQGAGKGTLLVVNRTGGSISLFDLEASVEIARVPIGPVIPHEVAVSPDGRLAMTGEYGPNDNPGRHLVVIDVAEGRQAGRIDLGPQSRPHSIVFMKDGRRAVVTLELSDRVALVDVGVRKVVRTYATGGREGHMVRLSPDGTRAYVTSRGAAGTLSVIALEGDTPPVVIPTGEGAEGLAVSPDGSEVWVVNRVAGTISVVDTRSLEVTATLDAPPDARRAEISAGGRVLVPHGGPPDAPAQVLSVYDLRRRVLIGRHAMHEGRKGPGGFGIHVVGERAFASDRAGGALLAFDLADVAGAGTIATNLADPDGLAYSPVRVSGTGTVREAGLTLSYDRAMLKERPLSSLLTTLVFVTGTTALSGCGDRGPSAAEQAAAVAREAEKAADEKAREERKARVEAERLAVLWRYQEATVGGGRQVTASILSKDNIDTDGTGAKPVQLVFRDHASWGRSSYLVLQAGDFECMPRCTVTVTVDDGAPEKMAARRPKTDEAIAMFINDAAALWRLTSNARRISIEFPVKAGGTRAAGFDVAGLDESKMPGWSAATE